MSPLGWPDLRAWCRLAVGVAAYRLGWGGCLLRAWRGGTRPRQGRCRVAARSAAPSLDRPPSLGPTRGLHPLHSAAVVLWEPAMDLPSFTDLDDEPAGHETVEVVQPTD